MRTDYLRRYPLGRLAEHVLGSVGPVTQEELKQPHFAGLPDTAVTGQGGVEYTYDQWLRGRDGQYKVEVDSMGVRRTDAARAASSAVPGDKLQLSINAKVQKAAEERAASRAIEIAHANKMCRADGGAAVVMDVKTGEIIASASNPTYDPTIYQSGTDEAVDSRSYSDKAHPLLNRVEQGTYPTGSTFKPITAVAALEDGLVTKYSTFFCNGVFKTDEQTFVVLELPERSRRREHGAGSAGVVRRVLLQPRLPLQQPQGHGVGGLGEPPRVRQEDRRRRSRTRWQGLRADTRLEACPLRRAAVA